MSLSRVLAYCLGDGTTGDCLAGEGNRVSRGESVMLKPLKYKNALSEIR
ncbi:hypothetical protein [Spirulina sp. 06S082]|nr:hypothetical protein [Spirulina sp. 06S082]MEA5468007.1 hypothetical protein [Spirulina sp. 06S082]